jgi:hypothetical protein
MGILRGGSSVGFSVFSPDVSSPGRGPRVGPSREERRGVSLGGPSRVVPQGGPRTVVFLGVSRGGSA